MNRRYFIKACSALGLVTKTFLGSKLLFAQNEIPSGIMTPVLTRAYDNNRTGANLAEKILTQASVKTKGIRKLFSLPMEGDARGTEAQVLIQPSVLCDDGTVRDVAIVTSMNNLVYAFDANTSDIIWVKKLGVPVNGSASIDMHNINDHWGLLSTGVIDSDTNVWYGVSWTSVTGKPQDAINYIHSLNLKDGSRAYPEVSLANISYQPVAGALQRYSSAMRKQRSSLVMTNVGGVKTIFFACGTVQETVGGAAGWIVAYDVSSNSIAVAITTTAGDGAGIWMGGQGLCADATGNLYGMTGNGDFDGIANFGECIFKAVYKPAVGGIKASLVITDWWSPYTDAGRMGEGPTVGVASDKPLNKLSGISEPSLPVNAGMHDMVGTKKGKMLMLYDKNKGISASYDDEDLGSAGVSLIPEYNIVLGCGKDGIAYLVNMQNMGKTKPADFATASRNYAKLVKPPLWYTYFPGYGVSAAPQDPTTLDFMYEGKTRHMHSTSVRYLSSVHGMMLFCWGENSTLRAWKIAPDGTLVFLAQSTEIASVQSVNPPGGMPGGFMTLSANGQISGSALLWASIPYGDANSRVVNGRFLCYDPENFTTQNVDGTNRIAVLWDSQAEGVVYTHNKFDVPVVSGGKIFLPTYEDEVIVLG